MQPARKEVSELLSCLPDDCTIEDIQYHQYILQKIERGLGDAEEDRIYMQHEVEARMSKWLEK